MPTDFAFALARAGRSIPARMAMMAMTTSSSMRVKPEARGARGLLGDFQVFIGL
jgi:hypothetical protein